MTLPGPPRVSVIIPAFNASAFIEKTLDSVRAQTYADYEVIVVDDGSQDNTQAVVKEYCVRHGVRGQCLRQVNKGIADARNAGIRAARGSYIALLDHDDLWYPEKLGVVMGEFDCQPKASLVCHNENIVHAGRVLRVSRNGPLVPRMYEQLLFRGNCLSPSATVFKREPALSIGGFREDRAFDTVEDYDFWLRLSRVTQFHFIDQVLGEYHVVDRAASRRIEYHYTNMEQMLRDHFSAYFGPQPGLIDRLRIRRRLSVVYRAAAGQLMGYREFPEKQRTYVFKMLRTFPIDPKNLVRAFLWITQRTKPAGFSSSAR